MDDDPPVPLQVEGTVFEHCAYGEPNYGENPATDAKESLALILLDAALAKVCSSELGAEQCEENVRLLQIATLEEHAPPPRAFVGRRVRLSVEEYQMAITGHHHTRVLLWYRTATDLGAAHETSLRSRWVRLKNDFIGASCKGYPL